MNPKVDFFFEKQSNWQECYNQLRRIILDCGLQEELKWGVPCYTYQKTNIILVHGFKHYCAILFHKGVLLKDPYNILIQQTENTQSARHLRFTTVEQIRQLEPKIREYIFEAIEVEKAGIKVSFKKTKDFEMVDEFKEALDNDSELKTAFNNLTPGRQRAYLLHFSSAKQAKTKRSRIEKCSPKILEGKGLNDF
ncbi:hypothetical protein I215_09993 [Galbibacter marinus]|uniref:YdhG-like domain-containing protein n=1 Tax=Galbibacter marinus TaxID=555500 RepID=K2QJL5_9FLAO|nr:DUF1801 domain-containing protein [Galbibacter marinus]EKF54892.1 hypothetical protein I215_09993 [Galbibacter marinus]